MAAPMVSGIAALTLSILGSATGNMYQVRGTPHLTVSHYFPTLAHCLIATLTQHPWLRY